MSKFNGTYGKTTASRIKVLPQANLAIISAEDKPVTWLYMKKGRPSVSAADKERRAAMSAWELKKEVVKDKVAEEFRIVFGRSNTHVGSCLSIGIYKDGKYVCDAFFTEIDMGLKSVLPFSELNLRSTVAKITSLVDECNGDQNCFVRKYKAYLDEPKVKKDK